MNNLSDNEEAIFLAALEKRTPEERLEYVDLACAGDSDLRNRVLELLRSHEESMGPFDAPPPGLQATNISPEISMVGDQIGAYKLLEQIGEGGFGIVYMADQQAPVRRRVALKIIKPGMDTKQVLARFKAELQALSLMDHPNIARALDAGATDAGRPYFVMELVRGVPITDYCDQNNLAVHERLDLFVTVCHAVQHAHQKGIIHRDIKPSNVLVTMQDGRPVPKVIDFGVAKAINQQLTQETIFTRFAEMIGTPLYMSPEQAEMTSLDIDTRSDIYSLGVLLYELLTGTTPFSKDRLRKAGHDEICRIIREEEPAKPSTRISTLGDTCAAMAAHRHSNPNLLGRLMRGDLDWIVMKALEKDRTRRYETANGLAMDLQRHLADEPVLAGPPSAAYRFHKFARRNRAALAMAAVVTIALLLGIVGTTWQAIRATRQRDRAVIAEELANDEREQAQTNFQKARAAVDEYFTLVSESKLLDVPGLQPLRKELLEAALRFYEKLAVEHTNDPGVLADLAVTHLRVAEVYLTFGRTDDSLASNVKALDIIDRLYRDFPAAGEQRRRLAGFWKGTRPAQKAGPSAPSDPQAAMKTLMRQIDAWQRLAGENPSEIGFQSDLAAIYAHLGQLLDFDRPDQAAIFSEQAEHILETLVRQYPTVPEYRADLARVYETLIGTFGRLRRFADSESAFRRSLELNEQLAADFPKVPQYRFDLAMNLKQLGVRLKGKGDPEQAVAAYRRAIDLTKGLVTDFPAVPLYRGLLTGIADEVLKLVGQPGQHQQEAEKLYRELMVQVTRLAAENPEQADQYWQSATASNYMDLAKLLNKGGQSREAENALRQAIAILEKLAADHPDDRSSRQVLGQCYEALGSTLSAAGRPQEAKKATLHALESLQKLCVDFPSDPALQHELGLRLHSRNRLEEAAVCFRREMEIDPRQNWAHHELGRVLRDLGRLEEAEACYRKELEIDPRRVWSLHDLGLVLRDRGRLEEAKACFRKAIEIDPKHFWSHFLLGDMLFAAGKVDEAVACYRKVVEINPQEEWAQQKAKLFLSAHGGAGEAEAIFRRDIAAREKLAAEFPKNLDYQLQLSFCHNDLATMLKAAGRFAEAEQEYRQAVALKEKLVADAPANPDYRFHLAHTQLGLANLFGDTKRPEEAERQYRQALALFEKAAADAPSKDYYRSDLGHTMWQLGDFLSAAKRPAEAEPTYRKALAVFEKLAVDFPENKFWMIEQGFNHWKIGDLMRDLGRLPDAEKSYRKALTVYVKLSADFPNDAEYRSRLAGTREALAGFLSRIGRKADAEAAYRDALALWEKLVADSPSNADYRWHLAGTREAIAGFLSETGRKADAETTYRDALALWEKLVAEFPTNIDYRWHLAVAHDELGKLLKDAGRFQDATEAYRHALPLWEKLSADSNSDDHRTHVSWTRGWLIEVLLPQGKHAEAAKLAVELARAAPDNSESLHAAVYLEQCAAVAKLDTLLTPADLKTANDAYTKQAAELMSEAGKRAAGNGSLENQFAWALVTNPKPELRVPARAVELAQKAVVLAPQSGMIWNTLGVAQYRASDWKAAIAALEKSMELRNGGDSSDWFFLGMCLWQQGERDLAAKWYKAARLRMAKYQPQNEELPRIRAEAAALMGLSETEPLGKGDELALGEVLVEAYPQASSYRVRGEAFANTDQWDRAADDFAKAIELGDKNFSAWYERALLQLAKNDKPGFQTACADMLKQFAQTEDGASAHFVAWTCVLGPDALTDFAPAVALAEKAAKLDAKSAQFATGVGAILYRTGRFDEARQKLEEADRLSSSTDARLYNPAYTWFFLAITHHRLGHADEAKKWLDKARAETDKAFKTHDAGTTKLSWNRRLTLSLLLREAEELLGFKQTPAPETKQTVKPTK